MKTHHCVILFSLTPMSWLSQASGTALPAGGGDTDVWGSEASREVILQRGFRQELAIKVGGVAATRKGDRLFQIPGGLVGYQ